MDGFNTFSFFVVKRRFCASWMANGKERKDPLLQLNRSSSLLRQLLQNLGFNLSIDATVVHINPQFTLYHASQNQPITLPTQVKRYLNRINTTPSKLNSKHEKLADKLISLHIAESPYSNLPIYNYGNLKKGTTCKICNSFSIFVDGNHCVCGECGHVEDVESAVLRNVKELQLLFPDRKITTSEVYEWCQVVECKRRINRILNKNYSIIGNRRWAYFE